MAANVEDVMFDMFKNEETGLLHVGKFLAVSHENNINLSNIGIFI